MTLLLCCTDAHRSVAAAHELRYTPKAHCQCQDSRAEKQNCTCSAAVLAAWSTPCLYWPCAWSMPCCAASCAWSVPLCPALAAYMHAQDSLVYSSCQSFRTGCSHDLDDDIRKKRMQS